MEEYVENKASDAFTAIIEVENHRIQHQDLQITCQLELEAERNQLANLEVFKATNGNTAKKLKLRQETYKTTRVSKTVEAAIKQMASLEF